jgi:hypothetical protein
MSLPVKIMETREDNVGSNVITCSTSYGSLKETRSCRQTESQVKAKYIVCNCYGYHKASALMGQDHCNHFIA